MNYGYQSNETASATGLNQPKELKGTAVDSVNANIEVLAGRIVTLTEFMRRISDGILGVEPPKPESAATNGPRPVSQSTHEHVRDLETAFDRLSGQVNRLG